VQTSTPPHPFMSCKAVVVKIYNATISLAHFENKNILFEKMFYPTTTLAL
jgi:hypothetical protein